MSTAPDSRVKRIYDLVLEAPRDERSAVLDRECGNDLVLRARVLALVANADALENSGTLPTLHIAAWRTEDVQDLLGGSAPRSPARASPPSLANGTIVDGFRILEHIGKGGFGEVYAAARGSAELATVAIKVLNVQDPRFLQRFEEERKMLERLDHPGIARIYASGDTASGRPYIAMELIRSGNGKSGALPITRYADEHGLGLRERLRLFVPVCEALHHAHLRHVLHRDVSPSNILVGEHEGRSQPKIIDFGIAASTDEGHDGANPVRPVLTLDGELIGTVDFMSPEQASGKPLDVLSDVYSLGVVLYHLVCGVHPLPALRERSPFLARLKAVQELQPEPPSKAAHAGKGVPWAKEVRGDLEKILLKILRQEPNERLQSAIAIAEELERFLDNRPIASQPPTFGYTLRLFARRHRAIFGLIGSGVAALLVTVAVVFQFWQAALYHEQEARAFEANANIRGLLYEVSQEDGRAIGSGLEAVPEHARDWEWHYLRRLTNLSLASSIAFPAEVSALAIAPDGGTLVVGDRSGFAGVLETDTLGLRTTVRSKFNPNSSRPERWVAAWHPAGRHFALGSFDDSVSVHTADGEFSYQLRSQDGFKYHTVYAVAFSTDGSLLAVGGGHPDGGDSFLGLHESSSGHALWFATPHGDAITDIAFSADGKWMATASDDKQVFLWDLANTEPEIAGNLLCTDKVNAVAFSPDSTQLAAGTVDREIVLAQVPSLRSVTFPREHRQPLASLAFHPNGHLLASASWDSTIRIWSVPERRLVNVLLGHRGRVNRVAFTSGGRLVSASDDRTVRAWDVDLRREPRVLPVSKAPIRDLACLEGGLVATLDKDAVLRVLDARTGAVRYRAEGVRCESFATSRDGRRIHWSTETEVQSWSIDGRATSRPLPVPLDWDGRGGSLVDDGVLTFANHLGEWRLDEVANRWIDHAKTPPAGPASSLQHRHLDDRGHTVAFLRQKHGSEGVSCVRDGRVEVLPEWRLKWNSRGRLAVLADEPSRQLAVYDLEQGKLEATLRGHRERVVHVAFSHGRTRLATAAFDQTVRVWDWRRGQQLLALDSPMPAEPGRKVSFSAVAWSRDDRTIVTGSTDGTLHFWQSRD